MADKNEGGEKTEKPTAKRLRDARKKGDLAKSKDFSSALTLIAWLVLLLAGSGMIGSQLASFMQASVDQATKPDFNATLASLGWGAAQVLLVAAAFTLVPAALVGLLAEFTQVGVVLTGEKMKPKLDTLNPAEGLKRMFSPDNLVELIKTVVKAVLILTITVVILRGSLDRIGELIGAAAWSPVAGTGPQIAAAVFDLSRSLTLQLVGWTIGVFLLVAFADRVWSKHRYIKKLMMSRRDIRQEHKDDEGDPMLKSQRRQMHEEWANQNAIAAAGTANVLLTNPTHLAIALDYDPESCPVPVIAAKGEGPLAAAMRTRAVEEGVPIVRNVGLARSVWATSGVNDFIPEEHFEVIAEIILWAKRARTSDVREREDAE
jgi:type III secretion YscU/HrpY family protein